MQSIPVGINCEVSYGDAFLGETTGTKILVQGYKNVIVACKQDLQNVFKTYIKGCINVERLVIL